jgi:hypothetical protein
MEVIQHHFIGGVYAKSIIIPDGFEVVSHKHVFDHMSVLTKGCVIVEANGIQETYYAPAVIEIKAGVAHSVLPVNGDAHWLCIHATDCTDETKIDEVLVQERQSPMKRLDFRVDVTEAITQLNENPELWDQFDMRTKLYAQSPHREVHDIWLRYRDWAEFDPENAQNFSNEHESVDYPALQKLPAIAAIIEDIVQRLGPVKVGGCLITRIPPWRQVYPHSDAGSWHAEFYDRKVLVLLQSAPEQSFNFVGEAHYGEAGEVFEFDNKPIHSVTNNSNMDRISLILALKDIHDDES